MTFCDSSDRSRELMVLHEGGAQLGHGVFHQGIDRIELLFEFWALLLNQRLNRIHEVGSGSGSFLGCHEKRIRQHDTGVDDFFTDPRELFEFLEPRLIFSSPLDSEKESS